MTDTDLLGDPFKPPIKHKVSGYFAMPGTGPKGETCGTCRHLAGVRHAKVYWKCGRNRGRWTGGPATDIRKRSPACHAWEKHDGG